MACFLIRKVEFCYWISFEFLSALKEQIAFCWRIWRAIFETEIEVISYFHMKRKKNGKCFERKTHKNSALPCTKNNILTTLYDGWLLRFSVSSIFFSRMPKNIMCFLRISSSARVTRTQILIFFICFECRKNAATKKTAFVTFKFIMFAAFRNHKLICRNWNEIEWESNWNRFLFRFGWDDVSIKKGFWNIDCYLIFLETQTNKKVLSMKFNKKINFSNCN